MKMGMNTHRSTRTRFGSERYRFVIPDYSRSTELDDSLGRDVVLRQLVLHGLATVLLMMAAFAISC
ncbi:hypothetical protein CKJ67_20775 [Mycobacterium intracellulare]|jgi:hypothetical protein|uniref:Uncharacterized protein n=2 Tax=Mycobacterium intracellulare TaxID=1767 RepID=H8IMD9_MYCIA|nr:hypothetical protein OCU_39750 [Mycobacterium intracellulare ATCC 13950]AFC55607.1 hypothetical protein OCQ_40950 [Mycobacterium paraintracellulare]AFS16041.1 Hypothetical protein MIP_06000 [Mycobacterium intracellulare subsp. intracellulare MTCC 9506]ASW86925.1 hypothetical protein CKJ61_19720 [Mycobacterium intracellulare]ASX01916.1 hypothetical protein CKJ58_19665 [Mycobacterium intracellulare subsp. chimaera]